MTQQKTDFSISFRSMMVVFVMESVMIAFLAVIAIGGLKYSHQQLSSVLFEYDQRIYHASIMRDMAKERLVNVASIMFVDDVFLRDDVRMRMLNHAVTFIESRDQLFELMSKGAKLKLLKRLEPLKQAEPVLNEIASVAIHFPEKVKHADILMAIELNSKIVGSLSDLVEQQRTEALKAGEKAKTLHQFTVNVIGVLGGVLFLLSIVLAYVIRQRMKAKFDQVACLLNQLNENNESLESQVGERTQDLKKALEKADDCSQAKTVFLAKMSHELRTPLNAIIGYSDMLLEDVEDGVLPGSCKADLVNVNNAGNHLLGLISDILDVTRIEAGKIHIELAPINILQMINDVKSLVEHLIIINQNELVINVQSDLEAFIGDEVRIRQIIFNLISNAAKFTTEGTININIQQIQYSGHGRWIEFVVEDTGIGLTPKQIEIIFNDFTQAENDTAIKYGGTGLGLSISKRLCHLMGGDICVRSEYGKGSVFSVVLPSIHDF
ncbi:MAG: hypothetical protein HN826_16930 [Methylococcales bacterium]|nr:hypothetical protein [Methylococcales bacterium]